MPITRWATLPEICPYGGNLLTLSTEFGPAATLGPNFFMELWLKKTKKICDEILTRFGDGAFLKYICAGKEEYPDQATFWRWRQKDRDLAQRFMSALAQNVTALLEKSELFLEYAVTRDEVLKGDKLPNSQNWDVRRMN